VKPSLMAALLLVCPVGALANFSFAISPPRFELVTQPGERVRQVIEITSTAARPSGLRVRTADWELRDDGAVAFHDELLPGSCRPWVVIERRELLLPPRQPYRFRFEIQPPADQPPTECRFAIMLEGSEPAMAGANGSVPVAARVAVIVYVAVGAVKPQLSIVGSRVELRDGRLSPVLQIRNSGTAHGRLDGFLEGKDARGEFLDATPSNLPILPGRTRSVPLDLTRRGDRGAPAQAQFPIEIRGRLEWGDGETMELDRRFGP